MLKQMEQTMFIFYGCKAGIQEYVSIFLPQNNGYLKATF